MVERNCGVPSLDVAEIEREFVPLPVRFQPAITALAEAPHWPIPRQGPKRRSTPAVYRPNHNWLSIPGPQRLRRLQIDPDLSAAYRVVKGDWRQRAELEARIVADQPAAEIVHAMRLSTVVVDAYEHWFFDVRRVLADGIDVDLLLGHTRGERLKRRAVPACWKWAAYEYGLLMLEQLLKAVDRQTLVHHGVDAYWQPEAKLDDGYKAIIAWNRMHPQFKPDCGRLGQYLRTVLADLASRRPVIPPRRRVFSESCR